MKTLVTSSPLLLGFLAALLLFPLPARAWWNDAWTVRKQITIDLSPTGAAITDPVGVVTPILIRLHDGDFQFASATDNGSDLRFIAADDKTPLAYHIEKYDTLMGEAFVWVSVPDVKPGQVTNFWLYYGNSTGAAGPGAADAKNTYDHDTALVYHFADGNQPAQDVTANANTAANAGLSVPGSLIGPGLRLDGKTGVTIPSSASMNWTAGQAMTWSAWVKLAVAQANAVFFSRHEGDHSFVIGADNGVPYVEVDGSRSAGAPPVAANAWTHLAMVADGSKLTLYVNGAAATSLAAPLPAFQEPSIVGADPSNPPTVAANGEMDELEISRVAREPGFIRVAALGQGGDTAAKLLTVGADMSPPAGWFSGTFGLFGVILRSVTADGWVVIGILGIMAGVSWYVMIGKLIYILGVEKGNTAFLQEWRRVAVDLTVLDHGEGENRLGSKLAPRTQRLLKDAPLYRIYHIGSEEIAHRQRPPQSLRYLSAQSIQAIRASLDGGYVRQNHALNGGLVFLTISIAGGPFMGLLGTCIGVMITFAAIAATGEVNISAIAPGLAAALVATVAGLLVAIPALLGYNYLTSRIKTITSDMQVFVDEFVTKMAEFYRPTDS